MSTDSSVQSGDAGVPALDAQASAQLFADSIKMRDRALESDVTSSSSRDTGGGAAYGYKLDISAPPNASSGEILPSLTIDFSGAHVADDIDKAITATQEEVAKNSVIVEKGDCVWNIAERELEERLGHTPSNREILALTKQIAEFNNLKNGNFIVPGQSIQIPQPAAAAA